MPANPVGNAPPTTERKCVCRLHNQVVTIVANRCSAGISEREIIVAGGFGVVYCTLIGLGYGDPATLPQQEK